MEARSAPDPMKWPNREELACFVLGALRSGAVAT
jgi:hypothetical protein